MLCRNGKELLLSMGRGCYDEAQAGEISRYPPLAWRPKYFPLPTRKINNKSLFSLLSFFPLSPFLVFFTESKT